MPTYTYKCPKCGTRYERLVNLNERDAQKCRVCKESLKRMGSDGFAVNTPLDTSRNEAHTEKEIDRLIGESSRRKWEAIIKRKEEKLRGPNVVDLPVKPGQVFNPESLLGDKKRKELSARYTESVLQDAEKNKVWDKKGFSKVNI